MDQREVGHDMQLELCGVSIDGVGDGVRWIKDKCRQRGEKWDINVD